MTLVPEGLKAALGKVIRDPQDLLDSQVCCSTNHFGLLGSAVTELPLLSPVFLKGASGPRGLVGFGRPGNQGIQGKPGPPGDPGQRGNAGPPGVCDMSMCYQMYDLREHYRKGPSV